MSQEPASQNTSMLRHIPNAITFLRIIVAAVFPFSSESYHVWLIGVGLVTEFLDGFIARTFRWTSYFGQVLDPVADKLFVLSVSLTWIWLDKLTVAQWLLLGARDFGVLFIFLALLAAGRIGKVESVKARLPSKVTTALQYLVFLLVLTENYDYLGFTALLTAAIGIVAAGQYAYLLQQSIRSNN